MTSYYTSVCFELPVKEEHYDFCDELLTAIRNAYYEEDKPNSLSDEIEGFVNDYTSHQSSCPGVEVYKGRGTIIISGEEDVDLDGLALFVSQILEHANSDEVVIISWAGTCSRSVVDGYGGGSILVSRLQVEWTPAFSTTAMIVNEMKDALSAGRPRKIWMAEELLTKMAAALVKLENGCFNDAKEALSLIVGDTVFHAKAAEAFIKEHEEDFSNGN